MTISLLVKARLNTRRSLMEPEKSSLALPAGGKPFQPRRRDDVEDEEEMAYVEEAVVAYVDPST